MTSLVATRPTQRRRAREVPIALFGSSALLIAYIALLVLVPSNQVVGALGGAGSPSVLFGVCLLGVWAILRIAGSDQVGRSFGVLHFGWLVYVIALVASYYAATSNAIGPAESRGADRGLLTLVSAAGVFLMTADGLTTRKQLVVVLKTLSAALILESAIALSQYLLQRNWYMELPFPGLTPAWTAATDDRSGFLRTSGTAVHAIEYGVVQVIGLATTLHWGFYARSKRARWAWLMGAGLVLCTLPLSIARSPMVGLVVVVLMLVPTWPWAWRLRALIAAPFALLTLRAVFPGTLGTVLSLFTFISDDPSTTGRTADYESVMTLLSGHELFGRGIGTVIPQIYLTLDNQYLSALLDSGLFGMAATLGFFCTALVVGFTTRARFPDAESRDLTHSLTTGVAVAAVSWTLFDGFAFQQVSGVLLIVIGALASLSRIQREEQARSSESPLSSAPKARRWLAPAIAFVTALTFLGWGMVRGQGAGEYYATASLLVRLSDTEDGLFAGNTNDVSSLMAEWMRTSQARESVREAGGTGAYQVAQGDGSLAPATDVRGLGPVILIRATSYDPDEALLTVKRAVYVLQAHLATSQKASGSPPDEDVVAAPIIPPEGPTWQGGSPARAMGSLLLLSALLGLLAYMIATELLARRTESRKGSDVDAR